MNHVQFFSMCLRSQDGYHSSQCIDCPTSALHISASAQDIKIVNVVSIL